MENLNPALDREFVLQFTEAVYGKLMEQAHIFKEQALSFLSAPHNGGASIAEQYAAWHRAKTMELESQIVESLV